MCGLACALPAQSVSLARATGLIVGVEIGAAVGGLIMERLRHVRQRRSDPQRTQEDFRAGRCRRVSTGVGWCQGLPEATDHPSITQASTMDMNEAPIRQEKPGQSLDHLCAARDSNPEPAD